MDEGPAEYAIRNGLTIDGTRFQPWRNPLGDPNIMRIIADPAYDHGKELPVCHFKPILPMTTLPFTQDDVVLINNAIKTCEGQELEAMIARATNPRRILGLKFELPVLRSHHRTDCRDLQNELEEFLEMPFPNHRLPLEPVSVEHDQGLAFPQSARNRHLEIMKSLEEDSIGFDQQTIELISKSVQTAWTTNDMKAMMESLVPYRGLVPRPLTPPIPMPNATQDEMFIPDDKTSQVPLFSDPSSHLSDDLREAEDGIFKLEGLWEDVIEWPPTSPPLAEFDSVGMPQIDKSSEKKFHPQDLKFEPTIFPVDHESDVVMNPDLTMGKDLVDTKQEDPVADANRPDNRPEDMFRGIDDMVIQEIKQEKIDMLDATARIPVPVIDFTFRNMASEWEKHKPAKRMLQWILEDSKVPKHKTAWPRNYKADKLLKWNPVTKVKDDFLYETLEGNDGLLEEYLKDAEATTYTDYTGKRSGLSLFGFQDDEDEDLPQAMPETKRASQQDQLSVVLGKRKALLDEEATREMPTGKISKVSLPEGTVLRVPRPLTKSPLPLFIQNEADTTRELLESFLNVQGYQPMHLGTSSYFGNPKAPASQPASTSEAGKGCQVDDPGLMLPPPKPTRPYVPSVPVLNVPPRVIASIALSKTIWGGLEKMLPGIVLLERDYNSYNTTVAVPWNDKQKEIKSPLGDEADIIVSPATGIILTTMTRVRQKSMAMHGKSLFCTRIERASRRYERLVVLISEGSSRELVGPVDAKGLAEFKGFAAGLNTDISVLYVAGGQESLAVWTAAIIAKHAHEALPVQDLLVSEETWWELFLRRAGLNTSAAQVVLSLLKQQEQQEDGGREGNQVNGQGLPSRAMLRFMQMNLPQRVAMFAGPLGGKRALQKVSKTLDLPWG